MALSSREIYEALQPILTKANTADNHSLKTAARELSRWLEGEREKIMGANGQDGLRIALQGRCSMEDLEKLHAICTVKGLPADVYENGNLTDIDWNVQEAMNVQRQAQAALASMDSDDGELKLPTYTDGDPLQEVSLGDDFLGAEYGNQQRAVQTVDPIDTVYSALKTITDNYTQHIAEAYRDQVLKQLTKAEFFVEEDIIAENSIRELFAKDKFWLTQEFKDIVEPIAGGFLGTLGDVQHLLTQRVNQELIGKFNANSKLGRNFAFPPDQLVAYQKQENIDAYVTTLKEESGKEKRESIEKYRSHYGVISFLVQGILALYNKIRHGTLSASDGAVMFHQVNKELGKINKSLDDTPVLKKDMKGPG